MAAVAGYRSILCGEAMEYFDRRLPIFILVDCSESMAGEPIKAVIDGLYRFCLDLKTDPQSIETAWLSVISFSSGAELVTRLTELLNVYPPNLTVGPGRCLGAALDLLSDRIAKEVRRPTSAHKGDYKPLVLLLTDGQPTDNWREALARYRAASARYVANFIAIGCGGAVDITVLREITPTALLATEVSGRQLGQLFRWVSISVPAAGGAVR
jgi:uncharacterized protein YegL